jgi:uncharacterized repeat protein (TIGR03803 family)
MASRFSDLFGTTDGGGSNNDGTVFELVNNNGTYTLNTLVNFTGGNGASPRKAGLIADSNGDLFGTTLQGGSNNDGTVFELVNNNGTYTLNTLVNFTGNNGSMPDTGLIADANGDLFGTTYGGVSNNYGTVFEITNSGFVPLDRDTDEQNALSLKFTNTAINAATAPAVAFTISGLDPEDTGTVTFTDVNGSSVVKNVTGLQTSYSADLSTLADGTITSSLAVKTDPSGNSFTHTRCPVFVTRRVCYRCRVSALALSLPSCP